MNRKMIFDAVRRMVGRGFRRAEVASLDAAIDDALAPPITHQLGAVGLALIRKWEGCGRRCADGKIEAYPDPGSADGHPWTIGWGSTGASIGPGTVWTQAECDARLAEDVSRYAADVADAIGTGPTSSSQFDALVSFHYNTGAIATATLTRLHREGRFAEAQREFARWIHNGGRVMAGLVKRRAEEAALYATG